LPNPLFVGVFVEQHGRLYVVERALRVENDTRKIARVAAGEFEARCL
jgi:hypothetical protein